MVKFLAIVAFLLIFSQIFVNRIMDPIIERVLIKLRYFEPYIVWEKE